MQTDTDFALLQLNKTYNEIFSTYGITPFVVSREMGAAGQPIDIISGYWNKNYRCDVTDIIFKIQESTWFWRSSYGYFCRTIGGTSGSPIVARGTRYVIGINNTGNESGGRCTLDEPCEIDEAGNIKVVKNKDYGQQVKNIYGCLDGNGHFDLQLNSCTLLGGRGRSSTR